MGERLRELIASVPTVLFTFPGSTVYRYNVETAERFSPIWPVPSGECIRMHLVPEETYIGRVSPKGVTLEFWPHGDGYRVNVKGLRGTTLICHLAWDEEGLYGTWQQPRGEMAIKRPVAD